MSPSKSAPHTSDASHNQSAPGQMIYPQAQPVQGKNRDSHRTWVGSFHLRARFLTRLMRVLGRLFPKFLVFPLLPAKLCQVLTWAGPHRVVKVPQPPRFHLLPGPRGLPE